MNSKWISYILINLLHFIKKADLYESVMSDTVCEVVGYRSAEKKINVKYLPVVSKMLKLHYAIWKGMEEAFAHSFSLRC